MKENYYSGKNFKSHFLYSFFQTFFISILPVITWPVYKGTLQDTVIKVFLFIIIGLGAALLIALCDTKTKQLLKKHEVKIEKDYASKMIWTIINHNIFNSFIVMNALYLYMKVLNIWMWKYELNMHVIVTPLVMLVTAGITYLYFKIRPLTNNQH